MRKLLILLAAALMVFGTMGSASALTIDWSDLTAGATSASGAGWQAYGHSWGWNYSGVFTPKTVGSVTGVGIGGGVVTGEIDWKELLDFRFDTAQVINEFQLSFLYPAGEFGDNPDETALIWVYTADGSGYAFSLYNMLTATGSTTADWNGLGSVENLAIAEDNPAEGALWRIYDNPFGDLEVARIVFLTPNLFSAYNPGGAGSDYSFVSLTAGETAAVPIPGAVWLLGSGLVGLAGLRRKFKN